MDLVFEFGAEELAVEAGDVAYGDVLGAFHLAGAGVGAGAKAELVHLGYHGFGTAGSFDFALGEECERADAGCYEQHG